jgi:choline dehydrogenase-like flavoprotein
VQYTCCILCKDTLRARPLLRRDIFKEQVMVNDQTQFTRDVMGRYVCNTFAEAVASGPFDVIIIGGGTFGLSLAQDLHFRSGGGGFKPDNFRVLVLEAGPYVFEEHVQDLPNFQIDSPGPVRGDGPGVVPTLGQPLPTTLDQLIQQRLDRQPLYEVWGLPWRSSVAFGGLVYALGGRSLYFGGWSPRHLSSEMHASAVGAFTQDTLWPSSVIQDLQVRYFAEAEDQVGATTSNLYINGALHEFYRKKIFENYSAIPSRIPLAELPDYADLYVANGDVRLAQELATPPFAGFRDSVKLDAPLAVQIQTRPGYFPFAKFSSVPLAVTAARDAAKQSKGNDANKRLMIVANCHVKRLLTRTYTLATGVTVEEVSGIDTANGSIDLSAPIQGNVNRKPVVVLAMGAIESARMALNSVGAVPNGALMGANLMVHLRKNVGFTAPLPAGVSDAELSALLVRCRANLSGTPVHFHLQITSFAVPSGTAAGSEPFLFQSVPDLDHIRQLASTTSGMVSGVVRAVGEMVPNSNNRVTVNATDLDEYGVPRASVAIQRSPLDAQLMTEMDRAINFVASTVFGGSVNASGVQPDGLGTTWHESGTLRMGEDPARSVVNPEGQFHYVTNLFAGDASVLPTCGSANPVMNGIALRRRLARRLVPEGEGDLPPPNTPNGPPVFQPSPPPPPLPALPAGAVLTLFDGSTLANWRMAGRGTFHAIDGALQCVPSFDLGLLWCVVPMPQNYVLELDFLIRMFNTNSGVFIRFTNPELSGFNNAAWSAVSTGFEIQIDNTGAAPLGQPQGLPKHRTGAVYNVNYPGDGFPTPGVPPATAGDFVTPVDAALSPAWNHYRIQVLNDVITVNLNGTNTAKYTNPDPNRGRFSATKPTFIGLQSYSNYSFTTAFRNIRATVL